MRKNCSHTRMNILAFIDRNMTYPDTGNICNCVIFTGLEYSRNNTEVADSSLGKAVHANRQQQYGNQDSLHNGERIMVINTKISSNFVKN